MKRRAFLDNDDPRPTKKVALVKPPPLSLAQSQAVRREVDRQMARKADYKHTTTSRGTSATIDYNGNTYSLLESMTRGDGPINEFEGSKISIKSIRLRGSVVASDSTNVMRIMVLQWFDSAVPNPNAIINNTGTLLAPYGTRYWTNKKNFKVLSDQFICLSSNNYEIKPVDIYISGKRLKDVWFSALANTVQTNNIVLMVVSDSSTLNHPYFTWASEVVYTD